MLRSPADPHEDHLRRLLDQRSTRADIQARFSSSVSEFPDTPSVYSHAYFSPRPTDNASRSVKSPIPSRSLSNSRPERNRLNDLAVSMLDLDDDDPDPRASYASSDAYGDDDRDDIHDDGEDDQPMPRMSLLGPKMRVHSKAPWEMDDEPLHEGDETDSIVDPTYRRKAGSVRSNVGSSRDTFGRRSTESSMQPKRSFETTSSQASYNRNPFNVFSHSNTSATSLAAPAPRNPFSFGRMRAHSPSLTPPSQPLPPSPNSPANSYFPNTTPAVVVSPSQQPRARHRSDGTVPPSHLDYSDDEVHPYANPDLARQSSAPPSPVPSSHPSPSPPVSRSDSINTVTDTTSIASRSTVRRDPPIVSVQSSRSSTFHGKEISSPIIVHNSTLQSTSNHVVSGSSQPHAEVSSIAGWTDKGPAPSFNLISLEEARAQRSRSSTVQPPSRISESSAVTSNDFPFPGDDVRSGHSPSNSVTSRARARSISAGARARQAIQSMVSNTPPKLERRDSEPHISQQQQTFNGGVPGKTLKHKRSGFMRMFNGGREDKPPPVPSLADEYALPKAQQSSQQKNPRITTTRVPVPQLSPALNCEDGRAPDASGMTPSPSIKRTPPPLSINTLPHPQFPRSPAPASATGDSFPSRLAPPSETFPQSAPPNVTEFPALRLRPVSTMFSAHFSDHIITRSSVDSSDADSDTQGSMSPGAVISPITPGIVYPRSDRLSHDKPSIASSGSEDQSSVIRALQEQIITAKKAWQRHIWELEGQVRDLKAEVEDLKTTGSENGYCASCGRGSPNRADPHDKHVRQESKNESVVNRPRARTGTGTSSRFGSAV